MLSESQIRQFSEDGCLVLKNAIAKEHIMRLRTAALDIVDNFDINQHRSVFSTRHRDSGRDDYFYQSSENIHCFLEEDALDENGNLLKPTRLAINKIGHAMHDLHPEFKRFCRLGIFPEVLGDLGYKAPVLWQTMYIFKQPRIGGEVGWHQDASYLVTDPPSVTGIWVAIEDATRDNGCLWVQPGGHRSPLRDIFEVDWQRGKGQLRNLDSSPWPGMNEARAIEVPAGSVVLFNDYLPHYSSQNLSSKSRHAFTMHVAEKSATWDKRNWLQRPTLGDFEL